MFERFWEVLQCSCSSSSNFYGSSRASRYVYILFYGTVKWGLVDKLGNGFIGGGLNVSACDLCFAKKLRAVAGSVYFDGPRLSSSSIYQSFTSSCKIDGYPFTTSTPSLEL